MIAPYYDHAGITIYCGDCRDVLPQLEPKSIDAIVTDPPYELQTSSGNKGCFAESYRKVTSAALQAISDGFDIEPTLTEWARVLRTVSLFVFCSNRQITRLMEGAYSRTWNPTVLVWHKYNSVPFCDGTWRQDIEFCIHMKAAGAPMNGNAELKSKCKQIPMVTDKFGHPTVKPLGLIRDYVQIGTNAGDTILDPYMGSGTTLRAAKDCGRDAIGIEIEERYCEIAAKRLAQEVLF